MSKYLVTITDQMGEVYDEFVITNPDVLIDLIGMPDVGVLAGDDWDA